VTGAAAVIAQREPPTRLWAGGRRGLGVTVGIAFMAMAASAWAGSDDAARTRAAIDAFTRAAAALEQGNRATAAQSLDGMAASLTGLRQVAARYGDLAQKAQSSCQARAIAVTNEIQTTYQQEQQKTEELAGLQARSKNLDAQLRQLQSDIARVNAERQPLIEEAKYRNRCKDDWKLWLEGGNKCWEFSFQDAFNNRYQRVNDQLADLQGQQQRLFQEQQNLNRDSVRVQNEANQASARKGQLEAQRRGLEGLDRATRAAVATLSDINLFWAQAEAIMQGRMSNGIDLLRDVVPALDKEVEAPMFDDFDKQQIRSLRVAMVDFAQSVDSGKNFLSSDLACQ
jgi:predicted  nucleic acid-binding Zn-ribbon protein